MTFGDSYGFKSEMLIPNYITLSAMIMVTTIQKNVQRQKRDQKFQSDIVAMIVVVHDYYLQAKFVAYVCMVCVMPMPMATPIILATLEISAFIVFAAIVTRVSILLNVTVVPIAFVLTTGNDKPTRCGYFAHVA